MSNDDTPEQYTATLTSGPPDGLIGRVINIVGAAFILAVLIIGVLAYRGDAVPDVLQNIAVGALASLTSLLVGRQSR